MIVYGTRLIDKTKNLDLLMNSLSINTNKTVIKTSSKKYICDYCTKNLATRQSKWRHVKTCDKKSGFEKRIELLESKIVSNIDIDSIVKIMNLNMESIKEMNQIVNLLYYNSLLKKIIPEIKSTIDNNIKSFQQLSINKNKFDKQIREQVNNNLVIINKLEKYHEYLEYQGKKQYLFRKYVGCLKPIKIVPDSDGLVDIFFGEELFEDEQQKNSDNNYISDTESFSSDSNNSYDI